jgi:hypothetical protein
MTIGQITKRNAAPVSIQLFLAVVLVMAMVSCSRNLQVGPSSPKPEIDFPLQGPPDILQLSESIVDEFRIPRQSGSTPVQVTGWRETLEAGFVASLGAHGDGSRAAGRTQARTLLLRSVRLSFVRGIRPKVATSQATNAWTGLFGHGTSPHVSTKKPRGRLYARIDFEAALVEGSRQLGTTAAVVYSRTSVDATTTSSEVAKSAVESMYQRIASELFKALVSRNSSQ